MWYCLTYVCQSHLYVTSHQSVQTHARYIKLRICYPPCAHTLTFILIITCTSHVFRVGLMIPGLFVPLHFRSRERKDHRENFRSRGTFVPWNIRSLELSLLWNFRSSGAKVPRTFVPWNIRSRGTFVPRERTFQELSFLLNCRIMRTNISRTFAPNVLKHDL